MLDIYSCKRKFGIIVLVSITIMACSIKEEKVLTDREIAGYRGDVRYVREIVYSATKENNTLIKGGILSEKRFIQFNKQGFVVERGEHKVDESTNTSYGKVQRSYDESGRFVKEVAQMNKPNERLELQITLQQYDTLINKPIEKLVFVTNGKAINEEKPDIKISYEYDKNGHLIKSHSLSNLSDLKSAYINNKEGKALERVDSEKNKKYTYLYDKQGYCIEENIYENDKPMKNTAYKYDANGNRIERTTIQYEESKKNTVKYVSKFNKYNDCISEENITNDTFEYSYTYNYEYDEQSNWIKQSIEYSGKDGYWSGLIVERQIEYFKSSYSESRNLMLQSFDNDMVLIKGGTFWMGSNSNKENESPRHEVTLSDFYMSKYEVTQKQWEYVMGSNPSKFKQCEECPVEQVSWNDIMLFITKLNKLTGKQYRLPTEAEWEYAAKGGSLSQGYKYAGSNSVKYVAWHSGIWVGEGNSGNRTHPVGQKQPNELGLYDMFGNVSELCSNWYETYTSSAKNNPQGPDTGNYKVCKGGSWYNSKEALRYTARGISWVSVKSDILGFRLCTTNINNLK